MSENIHEVTNKELDEVPVLSFEAENRKKIIQKLRNVPKEESLVEVFVEDFKEQFLKDVKSEMSESALKLWFPDNKIKVNLEKITADFSDTDRWESILEMYKKDEISVKDLIDFIALTHTVIDSGEVDPSLVLKREVDNGLKSRVGVKYIKRLVETVNETMRNSLGALAEVLELPESATSRMLLSAGLKETDAPSSQETGVIPVNEEVQNALAIMGQKVAFDEKDQEEMVKQFFAGDMIYDKLVSISYEDLLNKLADADDYEFDTSRTLIVDAGMEQQDKAVKRTEYDNNPENLRFVVYLEWLSNIFDGFGGTHSDDRGVDKYRIEEPITEEQYLTLMQMVKSRYDTYIEGRIDFGQMRMGWKTRDQIREKITSVYNSLTPYDKDHILKSVISVYRENEDPTIISDLLKKVGLI